LTETQERIQRVGYLGVGNIGEAIATNVVAAGFDLMVYDLRPQPCERLRERGALVAGSPHDLGAHSQLLEVSVAGDQAIEAAITGPEGVLGAMAPGSVIALHSTMGPPAVRRIAAAARAVGVDVLDAQVSGGRAGAEGRRLCYMVGGDVALFERCRPIFATSGSNLLHMGPLGAGASAKLAQQMMTCMHIVAAAEGARIATAAGVDTERFFALLRVTAGQSYVADHWRDQLSKVDAELAEGFYIGLRPALEMAHDLSVPAPSTALAQQLIRSALGHD
jgi:3-hydroxyisobutyrate dehydrogenase